MKFPHNLVFSFEFNTSYLIYKIELYFKNSIEIFLEKIHKKRKTHHYFYEK